MKLDRDATIGGVATQIDLLLRALEKDGFPREWLTAALDRVAEGRRQEDKPAN